MNSLFKNYKRIIFLGFRWCGKTTISKIVGEKLNLPVIDIDREIEKEFNNISINEIVKETNGWTKLRSTETKILTDLLKMDNVIISAGGGIGVNKQFNQDGRAFGEIQQEILINSKDTLKILLYSGEDEIRKRIIFGNTSLEDCINENISIMKSRRNAYNKIADISFNTDKMFENNKIDDRFIDEIAKKLYEIC